ncbi:MAG: hypothetical protein GY798_12920 [Hyphomicrobiales bacterium]|nr:hypothetical protein [Hyphomicrobiales bacterium]
MEINHDSTESDLTFFQNRSGVNAVGSPRAPATPRAIANNATMAAPKWQTVCLPELIAIVDRLVGSSGKL